MKCEGQTNLEFISDFQVLFRFSYLHCLRRYSVISSFLLGGFPPPESQISPQKNNQNTKKKMHQIYPPHMRSPQSTESRINTGGDMAKTEP